MNTRGILDLDPDQEAAAVTAYRDRLNAGMYAPPAELTTDQAPEPAEATKPEPEPKKTTATRKKKTAATA